jgi:hypothetical protein
MTRYWSTRMRRGLWTKNYHWQAANWARWFNFLIGKGMKTEAELAQERNREFRKQISLQNAGRVPTPRLSQLKATTFTVACCMCLKKFKRTDPLDLTVRPHKNPQGFRCNCKIGTLRF